MRLLRMLTVAVVAAFVLVTGGVQAQEQRFEVWVIDQSNAAVGGSVVHILPGSGFGPTGFSGPTQQIDLQAGAEGVGDGPGVRPHLLLFNASHSHGVLAYVASGHVQVIRASDRKIVASIDVGDQAHGALPAPDDSFVLVANQNGKKLARIKSDFRTEKFTYSAADDFDLKALEDDQHPDNAPICPVVFAPDGKKTYVTLRGGGMYIMDTASSPMKLIKSFGKDQIEPAGCGGVAVGTKMYINSGSLESGAVYVLDTRTDALLKTISTKSLGSDAHGMALLGGRYLWMGNRGIGDNVVIIDTTTDTIVGTFTGVGAAPDLMEVNPAGDRVFLSVRGQNNLTGGPTAKGDTPGVMVVDVKEGGRVGSPAYLYKLGEATSAVDPHGIAIRRISAPPASVAAPAAQPAQPVAAPPVQAPRALPRTGEGSLAGLWPLAVAGTGLVLAGFALRGRQRGIRD